MTQRSITIAAPAAAVYEQVADFRKWAAWSPWEKLDPAMEKTYGSNTYAWKGNDKVGQGQMTILASQPPSSLSIKLEFFKPRQDTSTTTFSFTGASPAAVAANTDTAEASVPARRRNSAMIAAEASGRRRTRIAC